MTHALVVTTVDAALVKVDAAYTALSEAVDFQSTRVIRDTAVAAAAYAREAKDTRLLQRATELRVRAESKCGQMLAQSAQAGERATKGHDNQHTRLSSPTTTTLTDIGITRDQSSQWQRLAAIPEPEFEAALATASRLSGKVSTNAVLAIARPAPPSPRMLTDEEMDDDSEVEVLEVARPLEDQVLVLEASVRDLSLLTAPARELIEAMPFYVVPVFRESLGRVLTLLKECRDD